MFATLVLNTLLVAFPAPRERDRDMPDKGPGYLGVTFEASDDAGILVTEVREKSPALLAGMRVGDVIVLFNGEPTGPLEEFVRKIVRTRPGTVVPMDIRRGEQRMTVKVRIGVRPNDFPAPLPGENDTHPNTSFPLPRRVPVPYLPVP